MDTDVCCTCRYQNTHVKKLEFGAWTYDEDRSIWLVGSAPGRTKWAKLSRQLGRRTDNQCLQRFKCLKKHLDKMQTPEVSA